MKRTGPLLHLPAQPGGIFVLGQYCCCLACVCSFSQPVRAPRRSEICWVPGSWSWCINATFRHCFLPSRCLLGARASPWHRLRSAELLFCSCAWLCDWALNSFRCSASLGPGCSPGCRLLGGSVHDGHASDCNCGWALVRGLLKARIKWQPLKGASSNAVNAGCADSTWRCLFVCIVRVRFMMSLLWSPMWQTWPLHINTGPPAFADQQP